MQGRTSKKKKKQLFYDVLNISLIEGIEMI